MACYSYLFPFILSVWYRLIPTHSCDQGIRRNIETLKSAGANFRIRNHGIRNHGRPDFLASSQRNIPKLVRNIKISSSSFFSIFSSKVDSKDSTKNKIFFTKKIKHFLLIASIAAGGVTILVIFGFTIWCVSRRKCCLRRKPKKLACDCPDQTIVYSQHSHNYMHPIFNVSVRSQDILLSDRVGGEGPDDYITIRPNANKGFEQEQTVEQITFRHPPRSEHNSKKSKSSNRFSNSHNPDPAKMKLEEDFFSNSDSFRFDDVADSPLDITGSFYTEMEKEYNRRSVKAKSFLFKEKSSFNLNLGSYEV